MKRFFINVILILGLPFTLLSSLWLKLIVRGGIGRANNKIFMGLGILPILDHYYQPLINPARYLKKSLRDDRKLPGINLNVTKQLELLSKFNYNAELNSFPLNKKNEFEFYYNNGSYCSGDAEYLYNMVRYLKPKNIFEIGSGNSTLMVRNAISFNRHEDPDYECNHLCIEPYESQWMEGRGIKVLREKVENIDRSFFRELGAGDILFIDSSHIIRPQGDVLYEYLELLPGLKSGVIIHIHDIFTPKDYLDEWIFSHKLWNEQYLLEAFLTSNSDFEIIGALNYLSHNFKKEFEQVCPIYAIQTGREPGAFWLMKK